MNASITKLYAFLLLLFALLIAFTSRWTVFDRDSLIANADNHRPQFEQQQIKRGKILSADGKVLAISKPIGKGSSKYYTRHYPQGSLFGNPVGYDFISAGRTGIEESENDVLVGQKNEFSSILEQLQGQTQQGSNLTTTLDAGAQQLATDKLQSLGQPGALVALDPQTGAIKAMVSTPGYDPNEVKHPDKLDAFNNPPEGSPAVIFNRATQGTYPPGSTMKVVTAAAALDSGEYTPDSVINGNSGIKISGVPLANDGGEDFGDISLTDALTNSVNTVFAQIGEKLGGDTMYEYMKRFGFFSTPDIDYPPNQIAPSGVYNTDTGKLITNPSDVDIGRVAIGQERLLVTPLQMAMVAATIANDGKMMRPTFLQQVTDPDGRVTEELDPEEIRQVISPDAANQLTDMMVNVTKEGTAAGLTVGGGSVTFAGKTGTAEKDINARLNQPWFIMFAPASDPKIAIAVTSEQCTACFGGEVAGPIATQMADYFLGQG